MVSMMLPQVLYIIPLYRLIFGMGLADTVLGVSLPLMVAPLAVFIMMQFIEDLPVSFIESAKIEAARDISYLRADCISVNAEWDFDHHGSYVHENMGQYLWPSLVTRPLRSRPSALPSLIFCLLIIGWTAG